MDRPDRQLKVLGAMGIDRWEARDTPMESDSWEALNRDAEQCRACPLHDTRTQVVVGTGEREARLMIIGEAPGAEEDRVGEPFVGRAGKLLDAMLRGIGLGRSEVYIANMLKCRPPGNRDPGREELTQCRPLLQRQIELVAPELIFAVGRIAAQALLECDEPLSRLRGRLHLLGSRQLPLIVGYHPAYLLRSPEQKAKAWLDLQQVARQLRRAQ